MAKPEWGRKRVCQSCSTAFYDFQKPAPVCPKCGTEFHPEQVLKARRAGDAEHRARKAPLKPIDDFSADEDVLIEDDDLLAETLDDGAETEDADDFIPVEDDEIASEPGADPEK